MDPYIPVVQSSGETIIVGDKIKKPCVTMNPNFVFGSHETTQMMTTTSAPERQENTEFDQFLQWKKKQEEFQEWKRKQEEQRQYEEQVRIQHDPQYQEFLLWQQEQLKQQMATNNNYSNSAIKLQSQPQQINQQQAQASESTAAPVNTSMAATSNPQTTSTNTGTTTNTNISTTKTSMESTGGGCFNPFTVIITLMTSATTTMNNLTATQKNANTSFQSMQQAFTGLVSSLQSAGSIVGGCAK
jgi:hypothetical protein